MSVLCGWASNGETGHARGNQAGNQGREVKLGPWYDFGQTMVIRPKSRELGKEMASIMKKLCKNDCVGYDQDQRTTLYREMSKVGFKPDKLKTKCETDCSAMIAVVCTAAGITISPDVWTGNLWSALSKTKKFEPLYDDYYVKQSKGLRAGDIVLNKARHVIMVVEDGPLVKGQEGLNKMIGAKLELDGHRGPLTKTCEIMALQVGLDRDFDCRLEVTGKYNSATKGAVKRHSVKPNQYGEEVRAVQCMLYTHGYDPNGIDKNYGPGMKNAVGAYQKACGWSPDYIVGQKTMQRLLA